MLLEMRRQVVLPAAGVAAQLAAERFVVRVDVHVISQPLLVGVFVAANLALVRLQVAVGPLVSIKRRTVYTTSIVAIEDTNLAMALAVWVLNPQVSHINGLSLVCLNRTCLSRAALSTVA